jgi:hypothetical protein
MMFQKHQQHLLLHRHQILLLDLIEPSQNHRYYLVMEMLKVYFLNLVEYYHNHHHLNHRHQVHYHLGYPCHHQ